MQVRKQQLELDMEQQTGSKQEKEYVKAVYCHPVYLTSMQKNHWHDNVLAELKKFPSMEEDEPLCKNKVPREGIVIRIENGTRMAFKLKCLKFYEAEGKNLGKTVDIEMQAEYGEDADIEMAPPEN